jgi:hypothetical protein
VTLRAQRLASAAFVLTFASCRDPTIWSAPDCLSPDGSFIATAHTVEHGGFGSAGVETLVELKRQGTWDSPQLVLAFDNSGEAIHLRMSWDSAKRLSVIYDSDVRPEMLYYQVVKTSGVEILAQGIPVGKRLRP